MPKEKREKKEKVVETGEDAEMEDVSPKKEKKLKKEADEPVVVSEDLSPIAQPLARKRLTKKLYKTIKRASRCRQVKRGVKEVVKGIRKGEKGILILAADISPIDIISHLPGLSEEESIPYIFVPSKTDLGHASSTKRPTSCVMICPGMKKRKPKEKEGVVKMEEDGAEDDEEYEQMLKDVEDEVYATNPYVSRR